MAVWTMKKKNNNNPHGKMGRDGMDRDAESVIQEALTIHKVL